MSEAIGLAGTVLAAVVAYSLGLRKDRHAKLRDEQIRSATDFTRLLMEFSGAQLRRRTEEIRHEPENEAVANAVRVARAQVWSSLFHVMLVVDDNVAIGLAEDALDCAVSIRRAGEGCDEKEAYDASKLVAEEVREKAEAFIRHIAPRFGIRTLAKRRG